MYAETVPAHRIDLPAAVEAGPAAAVTATTDAAGAETVHCKPAAGPPAVEVNDRLKEAVPPGAAVAEDKANESDWQKASVADRKTATTVAAHCKVWRNMKSCKHVSVAATRLSLVSVSYRNFTKVSFMFLKSKD